MHNVINVPIKNRRSIYIGVKAEVCAFTTAPYIACIIHVV